MSEIDQHPKLWVTWTSMLQERMHQFPDLLNTIFSNLCKELNRLDGLGDCRQQDTLTLFVCPSFVLDFRNDDNNNNNNNNNNDDDERDYLVCYELQSELIFDLIKSWEEDRKAAARKAFQLILFPKCLVEFTLGFFGKKRGKGKNSIN